MRRAASAICRAWPRRRRPPAGQVDLVRVRGSRAPPPGCRAGCRRAPGRSGRCGRRGTRPSCTCGISSTSCTSHECLTIGVVTPVMSHSWKASVPIRWLRTWPVMQTSGVESIHASAIGVTRFVAPGPGRGERDADPAGRARVALGHVARALLVAGEHVADASCRARSRRRSAGSRRRGCRRRPRRPRPRGSGGRRRRRSSHRLRGGTRRRCAAAASGRARRP